MIYLTLLVVQELLTYSRTNSYLFLQYQDLQVGKFLAVYIFTLKIISLLNPTQKQSSVFFYPWKCYDKVTVL